MEEITKSLSRYPSSFNVADAIATVSKGDLIKIKHKLEIEMESSDKEFSTDMEKLRVDNLLSFLCFNLSDREMAISLNKEVLERDPKNMIALSNKAWFSVRDRKNMRSCKEICERIKSMEKENKLACLIARAEVAFTYSRLGIRHYEKASSEFEKVLNDCNKINEEIDSESGLTHINTRVPMEYLCVWMYGNALCQQRLSKIHNLYDLPEIEKQKINLSRILNLLIDIIGLDESENECIKRYKARSYVELGFIAYDVKKNTALFPRGMEELVPSKSSYLMQTTEYFRRALEQYPDDVFVLERSGKYFRYIKEVEKSIHLLVKALRIKPTSFGYHHLALSFIRLLELDEGALALKLQNIPLDSNEKTQNYTDSDTSAETNNTYLDTTEILGTKFKHTRSNCIGNDTFLPPEESNDTYFEEKNSKTCHLQCYRGYNQSRRLENDRVRSTHKNGKHSKYKDTDNKGLDQMFKKQRETKWGQMTTSKTALYPRKSEMYETRQSCDRAVDKLTETFSQVSVNPRYNEQVRGTYPRQYQIMRGQMHIHGQSADFDSSRGRVRRPYNRRNDRYNNQRSKRFYNKHSGFKDKPGIKCPKDPKTINYNDNKTVVDKTFEYLDRASEMSANMIAIYDKALLYRQISQPENALEVLKDLMQNKEDFTTKVMLANFYEQSAYCISDILKKHDNYNEDERTAMEEDRVFYLKSSVEISCSLIGKIPSINNVWTSAVTLRSILFDRLKMEQTKNTLKELWSLYKKLNEHTDAIAVLRELQALAEDADEETEFIEGIVQHHLALDNFEEAIIALRMSKQLKDGHTTVEKELYIKAYVEAGLDSFRKKHYEKGKMRVREAFKFVRESQPASQVTECEVFDLYILSNLDDEGNGRKLMMLLNNLGLTTTFNSDSPAITPGTPEVIGMVNMMTKSNAFAIVIDFDINDKKMQHIVDRMQSIVEYRQQQTHVFVLRLPDSKEIPPGSIYATYTKIDINLNCLPEDPDSTSECCLPEGVKKLLMFLAYD